MVETGRAQRDSEVSEQLLDQLDKVVGGHVSVGPRCVLPGDEDERSAVGSCDVMVAPATIARFEHRDYPTTWQPRPLPGARSIQGWTHVADGWQKTRRDDAVREQSGSGCPTGAELG